ncbi:MAG TPA: Mo-dependent nitrogenase C-terminal domain-containing protein [Nodularia sp. (in: cyanobacteria)]|nr:Mo-dependent nitrogenase C-terminal domain-containing protein [Nodularia sp. (in: cyanobacteria)]
MASLTHTRLHNPLLHSVRQWLESREIHSAKLAHFLCKSIPAQCPFETDVKLFGHQLFHIPAMCKLNPLYEQLVSLRFKALCYLADQCGEDVTGYC